MGKGDLEKIRERLYLLISKGSDYSEILKVSQELDKYITRQQNVLLFYSGGFCFGFQAVEHISRLVETPLM